LAMSAVTSRDHPSAVLKAMMQTSCMSFQQIAD
jgi:hypothetical protein